MDYAKIYEQAEKLSLREVCNKCGMLVVCSKDYEVLFTRDLTDFDEEYEEFIKSDEPKYVFGTTLEHIQIDAWDVIENACQELHEYAYDYAIEDGGDELQNLLDEWCSKMDRCNTYIPNFSYAVRVEDLKW